MPHHDTLTTRQKQIVRGWADGLTDSQIASRLDISSHTVNRHIRTVFIKLNARTRAQAMFHFMLFQGYRNFKSVSGRR